MTSYEVRRLAELVEVAAAVEKQLGEPAWFRGHFDMNWSLLPAVFRAEVNWGLPNYERNCALYFRLHAPARCADCPPDSDVAGWMALMQHYRLPTRLLDWTQSPFVGLFFALWSGVDYRPGRCPIHDGELWALAPSVLNEVQIGKRNLLRLTSPEVLPMLPACLLDSASELSRASTERREDPECLAVLPKQMESRMLAQQGAFTIHGGPNDMRMGRESDRWLARIRVPRECRDDLLTALMRLGFRAMNLFPDLDHLSHDLRWSGQPRD